MIVMYTYVYILFLEINKIYSDEVVYWLTIDYSNINALIFEQI